MDLYRRLARNEEAHGRMSVAVVGAGYVGSGVVHVLEDTPGVRPALIVNRHTERAVAIYVQGGHEQDDVVVSNDPATLKRALESERPAVTQDVSLLGSLPVQLVIEATGAIDYGCSVILDALDAGMHVISFNAEVDALLGYVFHARARSNGVVYTIADGDQPGAQFRLKQQVETMGFEIVGLLNCKRHMDVHQTPESGAGYSSRDATSAIMTTAFGDGTKMQIEQAVVGNATGLTPTVRGMIGIETTQENAAVDIASAADQPHYIDFTLGGDFGAGVAAIARHPRIELHARAMSFYKMGSGPDYCFFRPYHLVHLELPNTIGDVVLNNRPIDSIDAPHVCEVVAMAKKSLQSDEALDCIGGFSAYGLVDDYRRARDCLPVSLVEYATTTREIERDGPIPLDGVRLDETRRVVKEWRAMRATHADQG